LKYLAKDIPLPSEKEGSSVFLVYLKGEMSSWDLHRIHVKNS
jgi:hypothetical protein